MHTCIKITHQKYLKTQYLLSLKQINLYNYKKYRSLFLKPKVFMYKKNIALILTIFCYTYSYANLDEQKNLKLSELSLEEFAILKEDYDRVAKNAETLTTGYSHSNTCFYSALAGLAMMVISYGIKEDNYRNNDSSKNLFWAGATLLGGSGSIGTVCMVNEHGKRQGCNKEKENLRTAMHKITHRS